MSPDDLELLKDLSRGAWRCLYELRKTSPKLKLNTDFRRLREEEIGKAGISRPDDCSDYFMTELERAIAHGNRYRYHVLVWALLAGLVERWETVLHLKFPHRLDAVSLHWNSAAWSMWIRLPWFTSRGYELYRSDPAAAKLYHDLFDQMPASINPGIQLSSPAEGIAFKHPVLLRIIPSSERRDPSPWNDWESAAARVTIGVSADHSFTGSVSEFELASALELTPRELLSRARASAIDPGWEKLGRLFAGCIESHSKLPSSERNRVRGLGVFVTGYLVFRAVHHSLYEDLGERQTVLIVPLCDRYQRKTIYGIIVLALKESMDWSSRGISRDDHTKVLKSFEKDAKAFGEILRHSELGGIATASNVLAPSARDGVDVETLVRETANWLERATHDAGRTDHLKEDAPNRIYNFVLHEILDLTLTPTTGDHAVASLTKSARNKVLSDLQAGGGRKREENAKLDHDSPRGWNDLGEKLAKRLRPNIKNKALSDLFKWMRELSGTSEVYRSFVRRIVKDAQSSAEATKPHVIFMYSEPGCGKEWLSQILHFARLTRLLNSYASFRPDSSSPDFIDSVVGRNSTLRSQNIEFLPHDDKAWFVETFGLSRKPKSNRKQMRFPEFIAGSFQVVNCGVLSETSVDFAHDLIGDMREPGSYLRAGLLDGTVFLDEFNTMRDPRLADHLLRAFDPGLVTITDPVKKRNLTLRLAPLVVIASNLPPEALLERGFNPAVVNRVTQHYYVVPPLRDRKEDLVVILGGILKKKRVSVNAQAIRVLAEMPWTDNLRGLFGFVDELMTQRQLRGIQGTEVRFEEVIEVISRRLLRSEESAQRIGPSQDGRRRAERT